MKYICLIYGDEAAQDSRPPEETEQVMKEYYAFTEEVQSAGKMLAGDALESVTTATTVRVRDGEVLTTDGPFAAWVAATKRPRRIATR